MVPPQKKMGGSATAAPIDEPRQLGSTHKLEGFKRYPCSIEGCNKSYRRSSDARRHEATHGSYDERKFPCDWPGCEFRANQRSGVTVHRKSVHERIRRHCPHPGCDRDFADPSSLSKHRKKVHGRTTLVQVASNDETNIQGDVGPSRNLPRARLSRFRRHARSLTGHVKHLSDNNSEATIHHLPPQTTASDIKVESRSPDLFTFDGPSSPNIRPLSAVFNAQDTAQQSIASLDAETSMTCLTGFDGRSYGATFSFPNEDLYRHPRSLHTGTTTVPSASIVGSSILSPDVYLVSAAATPPTASDSCLVASLPILPSDMPLVPKTLLNSVLVQPTPPVLRSSAIFGPAVNARHATYPPSNRPDTTSYSSRPAYTFQEESTSDLTFASAMLALLPQSSFVPEVGRHAGYVSSGSMAEPDLGLPQALSYELNAVACTPTLTTDSLSTSNSGGLSRISHAVASPNPPSRTSSGLESDCVPSLGRNTEIPSQNGMINFGLPYHSGGWYPPFGFGWPPF